jgi:hypothetical protein
METSLGDLAQFFPQWKVLWIVMSEGLAAVSGIMKDWYTLVSLLMLIVSANNWLRNLIQSNSINSWIYVFKIGINIEMELDKALTLFKGLRCCFLILCFVVFIKF